MTYQEPIRPWSFVLSRANGNLSVETITVASGAGVLLPGTVLAKVTASGKYVAYQPGGTGGAQTAAAVLGEHVDATGADAITAAVVRVAEVSIANLKWGPAVTTDAHKTAAYGHLAANALIAAR